MDRGLDAGLDAGFRSRDCTRDIPTNPYRISPILIIFEESTLVLTIANIIVSLRLSLRAELRCHSRTCAHVIPPLGINSTLFRLCASHTPIPNALLTSIALSTHAHPAVPSARRSCAHWRVLALEALSPPGIGKAECLQLLLVFLLWRSSILRSRHWFARLIDITGPSLF